MISLEHCLLYFYIELTIMAFLAVFLLQGWHKWLVDLRWRYQLFKFKLEWWIIRAVAFLVLRSCVLFESLKYFTPTVQCNAHKQTYCQYNHGMQCAVSLYTVQWYCTVYSKTAKYVQCTLHIVDTIQCMYWFAEYQQTTQTANAILQVIFLVVFFRQITNFQFDNNFRCCTFAIIVYYLLLGVFIFKTVS